MKIIKYIANIFRKIGHQLLVPRNEPHVEQKCDRYGNSYWRVHDFTTHKTYTFGSDRDVRAWLEQRYHSV